MLKNDLQDYYLDILGCEYVNMQEIVCITLSLNR